MSQKIKFENHVQALQAFLVRPSLCPLTPIFLIFLSTPLHHAAYGGYLDMVQLLIEKNATNGIKDNYGTDAYDLAIANGHAEVANYLANN